MTTLYPDNKQSVTKLDACSKSFLAGYKEIRDDIIDNKPYNILSQRLDRIEDDIALIKRALIRKGDE